MRSPLLPHGCKLAWNSSSKTQVLQLLQITGCPRLCGSPPPRTAAHQPAHTTDNLQVGGAAHRMSRILRISFSPYGCVLMMSSRSNRSIGMPCGAR